MEILFCIFVVYALIHIDSNLCQLGKEIGKQYGVDFKGIGNS